MHDCKDLSTIKSKYESRVHYLILKSILLHTRKTRQGYKTHTEWNAGLQESSRETRVPVLGGYQPSVHGDWQSEGLWFRAMRVGIWSDWWWPSLGWSVLQSPFFAQLYLLLFHSLHSSAWQRGKPNTPHSKWLTDQVTKTKTAQWKRSRTHSTQHVSL